MIYVARLIGDTKHFLTNIENLKNHACFDPTTGTMHFDDGDGNWCSVKGKLKTGDYSELRLGQMSQSTASNFIIRGKNSLFLFNGSYHFFGSIRDKNFATCFIPNDWSLVQNHGLISKSGNDVPFTSRVEEPPRRWGGFKRWFRSQLN